MVSCENAEDIHLSIGNKLLSSSAVTDSKIDIFDTPNILANFRTIYAKIMVNGPESLKTLALLKKIQSQLTGFDFRILFGEDKILIGLVWMTYTIRQQLL